jgi:phenylalanyl-tRNA synthetase beta chain
VRPINNIVDATNFAMLEIGEPLHAFDYDVLLARARKTKGAEARPLIITRPAEAGERLVTLDDVERELDDFTVLVCDQSGALALAGVMGGAESEVSETSRNILLEGAAWNMINTRRTVISQNLPSEAAYRFSRGVHPAMAERGVRRGLEYMRQWSGGVVYQGLVDNYPLPPDDPTVQVAPEDVTRWLGIQLTLEEIADILERLDFSVKILEGSVRATTPDHRLDIGRGVTGVADLMEEIARIYGYDNIPETRLADELPPQIGNPAMEEEERLRDLLVRLGLQEVITYRMTSPEREARRLAPGTPPSDKPLVHIANPIVSDRNIMRQSLLASVLEVVERNARLRDRMAFFEIAPIYLGSEEGSLPDELLRLVIILSGRRDLQGWQSSDDTNMDFYDLKGVVGAMLDGLHLEDALYEPTQHPSFHPGKCARVLLGEDQVGFFGELHPQVLGNYDLPASSAGTPILAAAFDLERLLSAIPERFDLQPVPPYPPVLEDLAVVVDEAIPAQRVAEVIRKAGGKTVVDVRLFDVYQGQQIGRGQKSLAYGLTYQAPDRTLTDKEVNKIRQRILRQLDRDLGAKLRS